MYQESYKILKKGLKVFPENTDLLADLLDNITKSSVAVVNNDDSSPNAEQSEKSSVAVVNNDDSSPNAEQSDKSAKQIAAQHALDRLNDLGEKRWTWRCYIFASDYYRSIGDYEKALELVNSCIQNLPLKQQGYQKKAELIQQMKPGMDGINESIAFLKDIVDKGYPCPQCANTLGKLYLDCGEYDKALSAFDHAVMSLSQDQPGINTAYVFFHRANCHDRIFFSDPSQSNAQHLLEAYRDYETALNIGGLAPTTISTINNRKELFKRYLQIGHDDS